MSQVALCGGGLRLASLRQGPGAGLLLGRAAPQQNPVELQERLRHLRVSFMSWPFPFLHI